MSTGESGKNLLLQVDGSVVGLSRTCTFTISAENQDANHKGDGGWQAQEPGKLSASVSAEGLIQYGDAGQDGVRDAIFNGQKVAATFGKTTPNTGDITYSGDFVVDSIEESGEDNSRATYSIQLSSAGPISKTTN